MPEGLLADAINGVFGGALTLSRCDTGNRSEVRTSSDFAAKPVFDSD